MRALTIYINNICNLDCSYCFVDKSNRTKSLTWSNLFEELIMEFFEKDGDTKKISIMGWEPLLNKEFIKDLVNFVQNIRGKFPNKHIGFNAIPTNWTIYDKDFYEFLRENGIFLRFSIDDFFHKNDILRVDTQWKELSYSKILSNIIDYRKIYGISPEVRVVVSKANVSILENLITQFIENGFIDIMIGPSYWFDLDAAFLKDFLSSFEKILQVYISEINAGRTMSIDPIEDIIANILKWAAKDFSLFNKKNQICWMGNEISISFDGNIYSCDFVAWSDSVNEWIRNRYKIGDIHQWVNWEKPAEDRKRTNTKIYGTIGNKLELEKKICFLFDSHNMSLNNRRNAIILFKLHESMYRIIFSKMTLLEKGAIEYLKKKYWIY